jgi:hypothetical protein
MSPGLTTPEKEDIYPSDFRGSLLTQRESNYLRRRKRQYPLPLQAVQRETTIDLVDPVDLAASMGWKLHQMDVKTSFLNGEIEERGLHRAIRWICDT